MLIKGCWMVTFILAAVTAMQMPANQYWQMCVRTYGDNYDVFSYRAIPSDQQSVGCSNNCNWKDVMDVSMVADYCKLLLILLSITSSSLNGWSYGKREMQINTSINFDIHIFGSMLMKKYNHMLREHHCS